MTIIFFFKSLSSFLRYSADIIDIFAIRCDAVVLSLSNMVFYWKRNDEKKLLIDENENEDENNIASSGLDISPSLIEGCASTVKQQPSAEHNKAAKKGIKNEKPQKSTKANTSTGQSTADIIGDTIYPIGYIESCFPKRFGCPRQGSLAPLTRARLVLDTRIVNEAATFGMDDFSHAWLLWKFHTNTNSARDKLKTHPGKVRAPQNKGKPTGVLGTRSPHRPNAIGLSLVQVLGIEKNENGSSISILLSGVDLCDKTPIFDIKPYVPHVDRPADLSTLRAPAWLFNEEFEPANVEFVDEALNNYKLLLAKGCSKFWKSNEIEEAVEALKQVIRIDPRTVLRGRGQFPENEGNDQTQKDQKLGAVWHMIFDRFRLSFIAAPNRTFRIISLTHIDDVSNVNSEANEDEE